MNLTFHADAAAHPQAPPGPVGADALTATYAARPVRTPPLADQQHGLDYREEGHGHE